MLHLITRLGGQAYAIESGRVSEVLPLVRLQPAPGPAHLSSFRHRGRLATALDLSRLILGRPFETRLSTRLLIVRHDGEVVGVVAENVTETLRVPDDAWEAVRRPGEPPYLGPAAMTGSAAVRRLELDALLDRAFGDLASSA